MEAIDHNIDKVKSGHVKMTLFNWKLVYHHNNLHKGSFLKNPSKTVPRDFDLKICYDFQKYGTPLQIFSCLLENTIKYFRKSSKGEELSKTTLWKIKKINTEKYWKAKGKKNEKDLITVKSVLTWFPPLLEVLRLIKFLTPWSSLKSPWTLTMMQKLLYLQTKTAKCLIRIRSSMILIICIM